MSTEPLIHSFATDCLPDEHPWARVTVLCGECNAMVHAFNNECMQEWVEWSGYALCMLHAALVFTESVDFNLFKEAASKFPCTNGD